MPKTTVRKTVIKEKEIAFTEKEFVGAVTVITNEIIKFINNNIPQLASRLILEVAYNLFHKEEIEEKKKAEALANEARVRANLEKENAPVATPVKDAPIKMGVSHKGAKK